MTPEKAFLGMFVAAFAALVAGVVGYAANIVYLFTSTGEATIQFILGVVGLFLAPIGVINGYLYLFF